MYNEIGIIHAIGDVKSGTSTNGNSWARQTFVLETTTNTPNGDIVKRIAIECGTKTIPQLESYKVGDRVEVGFAINAREYQGRWFNNVDAIYIDEVKDAVLKNTKAFTDPLKPKQESAPTLAPAFAPSEDDGPDLPF